MPNVGLYMRTLRHLRPRQLATRVTRRITRPRVSERPRPQVRPADASLAPPVRRSDGWSSPSVVRLLNLERTYDGAIDWRPADMPRLWVYHLNYFEDLPQAALDPGRGWMAGLLDAWIGSNPPGASDSWDPYPTSLRILNWVKWLALTGVASSEAAPDVVERALRSLCVQARWLARRLEFDIAANHLLANAAALTAAGFLFGGAEGDRWLSGGLRLLSRELKEQVAHDAHYERSPMYHAVVLEQVLDLVNLWRAFEAAAPPAHLDRRQALEESAGRMLRWLADVSHPDGGFAFFNDCTLGSAPGLADLTEYAARLGLRAAPPAPARSARGPSVRLLDGDFVRAVSEDGRTLVLFDVGLPSPSYQPGHAHSEALSFELSRDGRRVLVNSGVSTYEEGDERLRQRWTAAHNTVRIDGEEQCELWSSHRCGRRATVVRRGCRAESCYGEHDGYRFLPGRPLHRRELRVRGGDVLLTDRFSGGGEHVLEWFFHMHPDVRASLDGRRVMLSIEGRAVGRLETPEALELRLERGTWHPGFNRSVPNARVHATWRGPMPAEFEFALVWL